MGPRVAGFLGGSCIMAATASLFLQYDLVKKADQTGRTISALASQADIIGDRFAVVKSGFIVMEGGNIRK